MAGKYEAKPQSGQEGQSVPVAPVAPIASTVAMFNAQDTINAAHSALAAAISALSHAGPAVEAQELDKMAKVIGKAQESLVVRLALKDHLDSAKERVSILRQDQAAFMDHLVTKVQIAMAEREKMEQRLEMADEMTEKEPMDRAAQIAMDENLALELAMEEQLGDKKVHGEFEVAQQKPKQGQMAQKEPKKFGHGGFAAVIHEWTLDLAHHGALERLERFVQKFED
ncbi:hypothetical protein B0T22DRAFT_481200 [Podospora appendiculata]|uniref:Uncharacterized protein n=1 Tax=Podospora appendiculata TaxID=314037 RepID=A0AAE0XC65_9PEZI|nr:hypothetical protein B0T22DRAFT_481200 [Podospora appendiculata]